VQEEMMCSMVSPSVPLIITNMLIINNMLIIKKKE
jgi:hypothetical protein